METNWGSGKVSGDKKDDEKVENHFEFFNPETTISCSLNDSVHVIFFIVVLIVGVCCVIFSEYLTLLPELLIKIVGLVSLSFSMLMLFSFYIYEIKKSLLKGIPLELADLRKNVHYFVVAIINEDENICRLGIDFPKVKHFTHPLFQFSCIKEAAEEQHATFGPGLAFFIREDGEIVFLHPIPFQ